MSFLPLTTANINENLAAIFTDNRNTLLPVEIHVYSIRDYDYLRELVDGRSAVLAQAESRVALSSPRFREIFGDEAELWLGRTMLVDIAIRHDKSFEQLLESEEENVGIGLNHKLYLKIPNQNITIDMTDMDIDEIKAEHVFSYFVQQQMLNRILNISDHFSASDSQHIIETLM